MPLSSDSPLGNLVLRLLNPARPEKLRDYQNWMIDLIKATPYLYLAVDMGLGKTVSVLTALVELHEAGEIEWPVLVVAPKLVATDTWPEEIEKWAHVRHLTVSVMAGGDAKERERARLKTASIHLVNYENLQWLRQRWGKNWPYKTMVIDEATRIKAGKKRTAPGKGTRQDGTPRAGRRTSRFGAIARLRNITDRIIEMSGTPAPQGLLDLWAPVYVLDRGERLGQSMSAFKQRWFNQNPYDYSITPFPHAHDEITGLVKDIMFSLKREDYLELPPRVDNKIWVTLPPNAMDRYRTFEQELYDEPFDVEAVSAGVLVNKLLQFANGSLYVDDKTARPIHDAKMAALESVMTEAGGEPVLLAYEFRFDVERIMKRYPKARLIGDHKNWKKDYDAGRCPLWITHPGSAGHGLNLQYAAHIGVWFGLTSNLEHFLQFIMRLDRPGQEHTVVMHYLLARGTEDERQFERLIVKGATQDSITDSVRVRLHA